jgi:hypothetical protein
MISKKEIIVLNLTAQSIEALSAFITSLGGLVLSREDYNTELELTHIIVSGDMDFMATSKTFDTVSKNIALLSISPVPHYDSFVLSNGRLIIDQQWLKDKLAQSSLEKFFLGQASVYLDENFSELKDAVSFKVTNHLRMGADLDRLCSYVHQFDGAVVNVRTFMDHALYYLVYLKQAGISGLPFEVDYARSDKELVVQIHVSVRNFVAEYMLDSFGQPNGHDPLRYLLNICALSSDLFEIQYIENAAKLVLCGMWQIKKSERTIHFPNLMLNRIFTTSQIEKMLQEKITYFSEMATPAEELEKKPLPGHLLEMVMPEASHGGYLKDHPDLAKVLVAYVIDHWDQEHPDKDVNSIEEDSLVRYLKDYSNQEEIAKLIDVDINFLLERVKKHNVAKAYEEEIERVRDNLKEDEVFQKVLEDSFAEKIAEKVAGSLEKQDLAQLIEGGLEEPDVPVAVKGGEDEEDVAIIVKGSKAKEELVQKVTGSFDEELSKITISGDKPKADNFIMRISQGIGEQVKGDWKVKSSITEKVAPDKVRHHLNRFAQSMDKTLDNLSTTDLQEFSRIEIPHIIDELVQVDDAFVMPEIFLPELTDYQFRNNFQQTLAAKMNDLYPGKTSKEIAGIVSAKGQEEIIREVVKDTVKSTVTEHKDLEELQLIKALSSTLNETEGDIKTIIKGSQNEVKKFEGEQVIQRLFSEAPTQASAENPAQNGGGQDAANAILIKKLKELEAENGKSKKMLEALLVENKTLKDTKAQFQEIDREAKELARQEIISNPATEEAINIEEAEVLPFDQKMQIIKDMTGGKTIDNKTTERLNQALEREQKIIMTAKQAEADIKKAKIEMKQKEILFTQQIEKANRALKSKDMVLQKARDGMAMVMAKKDKDIKDLNKKISNLVGSQQATDTAEMSQKLKNLEKENQSLYKLSERYKSKMAAMASNMDKQNGSSNPKSNEEVRKLLMEKQRLEVNLKGFTRQMEKAKTRIELDQEELTRIRSEKARLAEALKTAISSSGPVASAVAHNNTKEAKRVKELELEIAQYAQKSNRYEVTVKDLEKKLSEMTSMLAKNQTAASGANDKKTAQLEAAVKKLSMDFSAASTSLNDAKKEQQKVRAENTALKNQLEKLKKDMEKAAVKSGAPSKKAS